MSDLRQNRRKPRFFYPYAIRESATHGFSSETRDECPQCFCFRKSGSRIIDIYGSTDICHHRDEDVITDFGIGTAIAPPGATYQSHYWLLY